MAHLAPEGEAVSWAHAASAAAPPLSAPWPAVAPAAHALEPKERRRPPAAYDEIRALLDAKQNALLAVAEL